MARKASMWAKSAGEYYRKNKGKNGIESFSDVLKSPDFKREYYAKYGKQGKTVGRKGKGMRTTKRYRRGGGDGEDAPRVDAPRVDAQTVDAPRVEAQTGDEQAEENMGGKRKGKGKSRKMKGGDFGNFNAEEFIKENSEYFKQLDLDSTEKAKVENIIRLAKSEYEINAGFNLPEIKDINMDTLKEALKREIDKKGGGKKKKAKKYSYKRFM